VWCGDGEVFPEFHLDQTGRADREGDAAAEALRAYLASSEGGPWGASSWVRVAQGPAHAQFLGRRTDGSLVFVRVQNTTGMWRLDVSGHCEVRIPFEDGAWPVEWWLDPVAAGARPDGLELEVRLGRVPCDPGDSRLEYVLPPAVVEDDRTVTIAILAQDRGEEYCVERTPLVVELSAPLGSRAVFDGGVYPPRPVTNEPP
jgi:hypothetical protein